VRRLRVRLGNLERVEECGDRRRLELEVLENDNFRNLFNDRSEICGPSDLESDRCVIIGGSQCDRKEVDSNCAYLLAPFVDNVDADPLDSGKESPSDLWPNGARRGGTSGAADRSRAGRATSQSYSLSQNQLLNCQLVTSSLPVNVVYVHRSVYLNVLSSRLAASPPRPVLFFAWDLDIVNFRYNLTRLDTSTVYYNVPRPHAGASARSINGSRSSSLSGSTLSPWDTCDHLLHEINSESFHPKRHQLNKFVWPFLEKRALPAFQLIRNFSLPREEYEKLSVNAIQLAKEKGIDILAEADVEIARKVACDWLRSSPTIWTKWFEKVSKKDRLLLVGMFPHYLDRTGGRIPLQLGIEEAARMGIRDVRKYFHQDLIITATTIF